MLDEIVNEVQEGFKKLDRGEYWTCNSHVLSVAILGWSLILLALLYIPINIYYKIKYM